MALVKYVAPAYRIYRVRPVHLSAFGLRQRHMARHIMRMA
jgi:hypothetical protein